MMKLKSGTSYLGRARSMRKIVQRSKAAMQTLNKNNNSKKCDGVNPNNHNNKNNNTKAIQR